MMTGLVMAGYVECMGDGGHKADCPAKASTPAMRWVENAACMTLGATRTNCSHAAALLQGGQRSETHNFLFRFYKFCAFDFRNGSVSHVC